MGVLSVDLSGLSTAIGSVGTLAGSIRSAITGDLSPDAKAKLEEAALSAEQASATAQAAIDQAEAGSSNLFVAGWRPAIGWTCAAIFAYNYVIGPLLSLIPGVKMPVLNISEVSPVLLGMLGLGTMRTVEKINGAQGNH